MRDFSDQAITRKKLLGAGRERGEKKRKGTCARKKVEGRKRGGKGGGDLFFPRETLTERKKLFLKTIMSIGREKRVKAGEG